ncbi:hypothetical protein [Rhodococcoides fascians]|uniref:hypothetical protein n=1 Tax=Rhodococcoides fascians TaxID=1828 RepID=UPI0012D3071A|nr:hypothetical protein [Rhodococcus fascians]
MPNPLPLDQDTMNQLDDASPLFVDAVHCGDAETIARITSGLDRTELIGLAISIATLAESELNTVPVLSLVDPYEGWTKPQLREAHAAYGRGLRDYRTRLGERIYQRMRKRNKAEERREEAKTG